MEKYAGEALYDASPRKSASPSPEPIPDDGQKELQMANLANDSSRDEYQQDPLDPLVTSSRNSHTRSMSHDPSANIILQHSNQIHPDYGRPARLNPLVIRYREILSRNEQRGSSASIP